ncbi:PPOX class F420-dependent oxidoreductase [soil metagenome]|jgi:PPOX class probable F420-dependent enzyme
MPMLSRREADDFLSARHWGVLATLKSDGRPQLSNVAYALIGGAVRVSITDSRAKTANARRDPRVSLHVASEDFWTYLVVEGDAELSEVASEPGDEACRRLATLYEAVAGKPHPDPDEFHAAQVADRRLELSFTPTNRYPVDGG